MDYTLTAKTAVKLLASPVLDICGVYDAMLARRIYGQPTWVVLMYHRVVDTEKADPFRLGMAVHRRYFEEQVRFHLDHFTPITVADAAARIRAGKPLPHNAVSFTFDDGYKDFQDVALPVLRRHGVPSTLYVTTGGLEEGRAFWWDRVVNAFARTRRDELNLDFIIPDEPERIVSLKPAQRKRTMLNVKELLWQQPVDRLEDLVGTLRERLGVDDDAEYHAPRMNAEDVRKISSEDVELAAHCDAHVDMRLLSAERVGYELDTSRRILQDLSGQPVNGFAYPGGRNNRTVRQLVARAGFTYAAGTQRGVNRKPYDTLNLRRIGMPDIGISDYKRCLAAAAGSPSRGLARASIQWP